MNSTEKGIACRNLAAFAGWWQGKAQCKCQTFCERLCKNCYPWCWHSLIIRWQCAIHYYSRDQKFFGWPKNEETSSAVGLRWHRFDSWNATYRYSCGFKKDFFIASEYTTMRYDSSSFEEIHWLARVCVSISISLFIAFRLFSRGLIVNTLPWTCQEIFVFHSTSSVKFEPLKHDPSDIQHYGKERTCCLESWWNQFAQRRTSQNRWSPVSRLLARSNMMPIHRDFPVCNFRESKLSDVDVAVRVHQIRSRQSCDELEASVKVISMNSSASSCWCIVSRKARAIPSSSRSDSIDIISVLPASRHEMRMSTAVTGHLVRIGNSGRGTNTCIQSAISNVFPRLGIGNGITSEWESSAKQVSSNFREISSAPTPPAVKSRMTGIAQRICLSVGSTLTSRRIVVLITLGQKIYIWYQMSHHEDVSHCGMSLHHVNVNAVQSCAKNAIHDCSGGAIFFEPDNSDESIRSFVFSDSKIP